MNNKAKMYFRQYLYLFLAIFLWSLIPAISKLASSDIRIGTYLFYSNLLSMLIIFPFIKFKNLFKKESILKGLIFGFLGVFAYYLLLYSAYKYSNSAQLVLIIQYTWPALTVIFAIFILKENITARKIIAILIAFFAFLLTITNGFKILPNFSDNLSLILAFLGAISFSLYSVLSKKFSKKNASNDVFLTFFFAWIYSILYLIILHQKPIIPKNAIFYLVINGFFINGISYLFWIWALEKIEASKASIFVFATPVIATFWIYLLIGENLKLISFLSILLLITSGIIVIKKHK